MQEDFAEQIVAFQGCYRTIKRDFEKQNYDLYLLKTHANTLLDNASKLKTSENLDWSRLDQEELNNLIANIRKLIRTIEKEIEIQTNEEYYSSNNNEI